MPLTEAGIARYEGRSDVKRSGGELKGPCPHCGGEDRFWVHLRGRKRGYFGCRGCEPHTDRSAARTILRQLDGERQWRPARETPEVARKRKAEKEREDELEAAKMMAEARAWWNAGLNPSGTPAELYCRRRGVELAPGYRWVRMDQAPQRWIARQAPAGTVGWAVQGYVAPDGSIPAVHLEPLTSDGIRPVGEDGKRKRMARGKFFRGLFWLPGEGGPLHVCEGAVTAQGIRAILGPGANVVAVGNDQLAQALHLYGPLPNGCVIHFDTDPKGSGQDAGEKLAERLIELGVEVQPVRYGLKYDAADVTERAAHDPEYLALLDAYRAALQSGLDSGLGWMAAHDRALPEWERLFGRAVSSRAPELHGHAAAAENGPARPPEGANSPEPGGSEHGNAARTGCAPIGGADLPEVPEHVLAAWRTAKRHGEGTDCPEEVLDQDWDECYTGESEGMADLRQSEVRLHLQFAIRAGYEPAVELLADARTMTGAQLRQALIEVCAPWMHLV